MRPLNRSAADRAAMNRGVRVVELLESGMTYRQVADIYNVSNERIRQIYCHTCKQNRIPRDPRDRAVAPARRRIAVRYLNGEVVGAFLMPHNRTGDPVVVHLAAGATRDHARTLVRQFLESAA